jgi:glycosyltransferase involved in cell wall biosynthesis
VLLLHNRYRHVGGEEQYVRQLHALLQREADSVSLLERSSSAVSSLAAARGMLTGGLYAEQVAEIVRREGITIVHAHNVHPAFGFRSLAAARDAGAAVVLQLHNYRLFCAIGVAYRASHDCVECAPRNTINGLRHNCRGSLAEAAVYAAGLARQQPRLIEHADVIAVPAQRLADDLRQLGLPVDPETLPTPVPADALVDGSTAADGSYGIYVGRLTEDKGILWAVRAAAAAEVPLRVCGTGDCAEPARSLAVELGADVQFLGMVGRDELRAVRRGAAFAVVPSLCREVMPLSGLEAIASGLPLVVSDRGAMATLTEPQLVVPAGDEASLAGVMTELMAGPELRGALGARSVERARTDFAEAAYAARLAEIYSLAAARLGSSA